MYFAVSESKIEAENISDKEMTTHFLSTPAESTLASSLVKMRPTRSVPSEIGLDFLPLRCLLI